MHSGTYDCQCIAGIESIQLGYYKRVGTHIPANYVRFYISTLTLRDAICRNLQHRTSPDYEIICGAKIDLASWGALL